MCAGSYQRNLAGAGPYASRMHTTLQRHEVFGAPLGARQIGGYHFSLTRYLRGTRIPPHTHGEAFATVVVDGGYDEAVEGTTRQCAAQSIVVHAAGERHEDVVSSRGATCLNIHGGPFVQSALADGAAAAAIALKLQREFRTPDELSPLAVEALLLELTVVTGRARRETRGLPSWLAEVGRTLERRFAEPLTLGELAAVAEVHPAHLARAFRRHFGLTVGERLRELRVGQARRRLAGNAPLGEVALDCGFADQSHFTRTFRRATGLTPAAFRRLLR
jgi:AraC family transcriptional regulator